MYMTPPGKLFEYARDCEGLDWYVTGSRAENDIDLIFSRAPIEQILFLQPALNRFGRPPEAYG